VSRGSVAVGGEVVGAIGHGLLALLGVGRGDGEDQARWICNKLLKLRVFEDTEGRMNRNVVEAGGGILLVSQFTLYGDVRKGRRPSFIDAARPEQAEPLYQRFCQLLAAEGVAVEQGVFQAHMQITLVNDGPVTIWLDTATLM
jgi:D-tyrosyl-tRNA(Tyr) deacylase